MVREYRLTYDNSRATGRSRLTEVKEFGRNGATNLTATHFNWTDVENRLEYVNFDGAGGHQLWSSEDWDPNHRFSRIADITGDGIPDLISFQTDGIWVWESSGSGIIGVDSNKKNGATRWYSGNWDPSSRSSKIADINADGMADIISFQWDGLWVLQSTGNGFAGVNAAQTDGAQRWSAENWDPNHRKHGLADVNGDGKTDMVSFQWDGLYIWETSNGVSDMMNAITSGLGASLTVQYKPLTDLSIYDKDNDADYPARDLQGPMNVVSAYETDNGIGGTSSISYRYAGLKATLDGRGPCGFRFIEATNDQTGIRTKTYYRQDFPYKSMAWKSETCLADGTLLGRSTHTWDVKNFSHNRFFPYIRQTLSESYNLDGSLISSKTINNTYDDFGNPTQITAIFGSGHTENTVNNYTNDLNRWYLGRLTRAEVTKQAPGQPALSRTSSFAYDAATGLLIKEVIEPDHPILRLEKTYTHDVFGNITESTTKGPGIVARGQKTTYDTRGQFVVESINALEHSETKTYDLHTGKTLTLTGPNGLTTTWEYDGFGRPLLETRADGTQTRTVYFQADENSPDNAVYYVRTDTSGSVPTITYYDLLNREIRKETVGFDGRRIFVDKEYNALGQVERVSDPYFEGDDPIWTVNEYDVLRRLTRQTAPGNRISTTSYAGHTTTVTNPLGQQNTRSVNDLGQMIKSIDNLGNAIQYTYDSFGNLVELRDPAGNVTTMVYDIRGNKLSMNDPDSGLTSYQYNPLGELLSQTDAIGNTVAFEYDKLGRLVERNEPEGVSLWEYDSAPNGIGKLSRVTQNNSFEEIYSYDEWGRPVQTETIIYGDAFLVNQDYDQYSRPKTLTYPSGFQIYNAYNSFGFLHEVRRSEDNWSLWRANAFNAKGQLEMQTYGNGLVNHRSHDVFTGHLQKTRITNVQDLSFNFDAIGNLVQRQDHLEAAVENFEYDALNRLTRSDVLGEVSIEMSYDILGNITSKSDVGTYTYGENGAGPHAVTSTTGLINEWYEYDANGNRISSNEGWIEYTSFNKPHWIEDDDAEVSFEYGPNRNRIIQAVNKDGVETTKYYIGGLYEEEYADDGYKAIHFIRGGGSTAAIYTEKEDGTEATRFLHKDHLGSLHTITDEAGNVTEVLSFDAWGNRRNADWTPATSEIEPEETNRGFTGHEHLDAVSLVHMNGRVYDPVIGRFLSPDPHIQAPENTQSLNRYSYVLNNPLSYTDPSGFFWNKLKKAFKNAISFVEDNWKKIAVTAAAVVTGGWVAGAVVGSAVNLEPFNTINKALLSNKYIRLGGQILAGALDIVGCAGYCSATYNAYLSYVGGGDIIDIAFAAVDGYAQGQSAIQGFSAFKANPLGFAKTSARSYLRNRAGKQADKLLRENLNISLSAFNSFLLAGSFVGNKLVGTRFTRNYDKTGSTGIYGVLSRQDTGLISGGTLVNKVIGAPFDAVDIILGYQGKPTASSFDFLRNSSGAGVLHGHSLGALDVVNLRSFGLISAAHVDALPFGNISTTNVSISISSGDVINGFGIGMFFNPDSNLISGDFLGHSLCGTYGPCSN